MARTILAYGVLAGMIAGLPLFGLTVALSSYTSAPWGLAVGYLVMLIALGTIFVAVKRRRDGACGGVIGFWPALTIGLGITIVAGLFYVAAWEAALAATHMDFAGRYADAVIARRMETGASAAELARVAAQMDRFKANYADPVYRAFMTFAEIAPIGVLVSILTAALLRNPGFRPRRI